MDNKWNTCQVHVNHQLSPLRCYHKIIIIIVIYFQVLIITIMKTKDYNKNKKLNKKTILIQNQTQRIVQIQTNITNH